LHPSVVSHWLKPHLSAEEIRDMPDDTIDDHCREIDNARRTAIVDN
jgi:hypothetical protein